MDIWKCAAEVILEHTQAASSYVAVVTTPLEADYQWPEAEEDGEGEGLAETDDEAEDAPPPVAAEPVEGEDPPAEVRAARSAAGEFNKIDKFSVTAVDRAPHVFVIHAKTCNPLSAASS